MRLIETSLRAIREEVPWAYARLCRVLGELRVAVQIDNETFTVQGQLDDVGVRCRAEGESIRVDTSRRAIVDLIDGRLSLEQAVVGGQVRVHAAARDLLALHDALMLYVHGAVRAPSCEGLSRMLREAGSEQEEQALRRHESTAGSEEV